jgi:pSer/pThr/pTyr-binding forkhead associated (FHA) protein
MPAQLLALTEGPSILVDKPVLLVGRHPECDIQVDSRKISRRHCCIAQVHDYLVVRDLGSTNGIRINGVRVLEGVLKPGDELTIGNNRFQLRWHDVDPPASVLHSDKDAIPPVVRSALPDDVLENCDDPVALSDEDKESLPRARPAGPAPVKSPAQEPADPHPVLPDQLELAPISDVFRPDPSPSHPGS